MYEIKCALCDALIGYGSVECTTDICGSHTIEEVNNYKNPITWDTVRDVRNQILTNSDWTQLEDAPLTQEEKDHWATYRQYLRDIPKLFATPQEVIYPEIGDFE